VTLFGLLSSLWAPFHQTPSFRSELWFILRTHFQASWSFLGLDGTFFALEVTKISRHLVRELVYNHSREVSL
jgi:hypothetical protein